MSKKKTTPPDGTPARPANAPAKPEPGSEPRPRVHKELEGFNIQINSFGEISNSYDIDKINQFLNKTVDDKKLRHRADLRQLKGETDPVSPVEDILPEDDLPDDMLPIIPEKE